MKHIYFILLLIALVGCNQRRSRKIVVPKLGKFILSDSTSAPVDEETVQLTILRDSSLLNDYKVQIFDSNTASHNLIKYSSKAEIVTELNARGRYEDVYFRMDTMIPRHRPERNPVFFNITDSNLEITNRLYTVTTDYNDSTFKTNHPVISVGQRKNAAKVLALIETKYFPSNLFSTKIFNYSPQEKDFVNRRYKICDSSQKWKFWQSPSVAFGTAIPISQNIVLTAGHCVNDVDINHFYMVLDYNDTSSASQGFSFDTSNIYRGIKVIDMANDQKRPNSDYCFIQLNKSLPLSSVMEYKRNRPPQSDNKYYLIGYPLGIPERISLGHLISEDLNTGIYTVFLDSFGGNSGSPVFESKTDSLIGMLYYGEYDFIRDPYLHCNAFRFCSAKISCVGESVASIPVLLSKPVIKKYLGN